MMEKLEETLILYRSYFGLDDASLEKHSQGCGVHVSGQEFKANTVLRGESLEEKCLSVLKKFIVMYI